jgi:hypothetical protein
MKHGLRNMFDFWPSDDTTTSNDEIPWYNLQSFIFLFFWERSEVHPSLLTLWNCQPCEGLGMNRFSKDLQGTSNFWTPDDTTHFFLYIEDQRILGITVQNLAFRTTWRLGFFLRLCDGYFWTLLPWEIPALKDSHGFRSYDKDFMNKKLLLFCNLVK